MYVVHNYISFVMRTELYFVFVFVRGSRFRNISLLLLLLITALILVLLTEVRLSFGIMHVNEAFVTSKSLKCPHDLICHLRLSCMISLRGTNTSLWDVDKK